MKKIIVILFSILLMCCALLPNVVKAEDDIEYVDVYYYEVVFTDANGNIIQRGYVKAGDSVSPPQAPYREGYKFLRWDKTLDNIQGATYVHPVYQELNPQPVSNESSNKQEEPKEIEMCEVTFYDSDTIIETREIECDKVDTAMPNTIPSKDGYELIGFEKGSDGNLHAKWKEVVVEPAEEVQPEPVVKNGNWSLISLMLCLLNLYLGSRLMFAKRTYKDNYNNVQKERKHPLLLGVIGLLLSLAGIIIIFVMNKFNTMVWLNNSTVVEIIFLLFLGLMFLFSYLFSDYDQEEDSVDYRY